MDGGKDWRGGRQWTRSEWGRETYRKVAAWYKLAILPLLPISQSTIKVSFFDLVKMVKKKKWKTLQRILFAMFLGILLVQTPNRPGDGQHSTLTPSLRTAGKGSSVQLTPATTHSRAKRARPNENSFSIRVLLCLKF